MDLSGNKDLLDRELVAFFASRNSPPEAFAIARLWAYEISKTDKVVISGFHSPLEKEVLHILLEVKHPIVIALGRKLYKRIPQEYIDALNEGRMLILNVCTASRQNWWTAQYRNYVIADYAEECYFVGIHQGSSLDVLYDIRQCKSRKLEELAIYRKTF